MLMALTGVFSYLDLQVISASIKTAESGEITDEFIVQTSDGGKVQTSDTTATITAAAASKVLSFISVGAGSGDYATSPCT